MREQKEVINSLRRAKRRFEVEPRGQESKKRWKKTHWEDIKGSNKRKELRTRRRRKRKKQMEKETELEKASAREDRKGRKSASRKNEKWRERRS